MIKRLFHLTENQLKQLQNESKLSGLSVAEILRRIIDNYYSKK